MMEQVSWQLYVMLVSTVVGVYYLYVGFRYYRQDVKRLLSRVLKPPNSNKSESIQVEELEALNQAAQLLEEAFDQFAGMEINRDEALSLVREQLAGISGLEKPVIRQSLEQLVASKTKAAFGLDLTPSELKTIW